MSKRTVIIQRLIPDYRAALFAQLHQKFGWTVAASATLPSGSFMQPAQGVDGFARFFPCDFGDGSNEYACQFPLDQIIEEMRPERIIAEFSMANNLWRELPRLRSAGRIQSFAYWTHGWNMATGFGSPKNLLRQYGRLLPLSQADLLLSYTEEGRNWLNRWLPHKPVVALGNALDVDKIRTAAIAATPIRHGSPQLLAVGRLTKEKRFDRLIALCARLKSDFPGTALTIIGDGPEKGRLAALADEIGGGCVTLTGAIRDEEELASHFLGADYFVMTGAAGLSVNHALAYGVPVVAYARGRGLPHNGPEIEYVVEGQTGLLCRHAGDDALFQVLFDAISGNASEKLKRTIPAYVDAKMRLENVVANFARADGVF